MAKTYKINEVAKIFGVSPSAIRFYEKKGLFSPAKNEENGYRTFDDDDIYILWSIIYHRHLDMSVSDIYRLKHSDSLTDIYDMVQHQKSGVLLEMERQKRQLAAWEYYESVAEKAMRWCDPPRAGETGCFHIFSKDTFYNSRQSTFFAGNPGYRFVGEEQKGYFCDSSFNLIFDDGMRCVVPEDRQKQKEEVPPFLALSLVIRREGDFDEDAALDEALNRAKSAGYDVKTPFYVIYLMSTGDWDHAVRYYEALLPLQ